MVTPELHSYIQWQKANNIPASQVHSLLLEQGWADVDINDALSGYSTVQKVVTHHSPPLAKQSKPVSSLVVIYAWLLLIAGLQEIFQGVLVEKWLMVSGILSIVLSFGIRGTHRWAIVGLTILFAVNYFLYMTNSDIIGRSVLEGTVGIEGLGLIYFWLSWN